VGSEVFLEALGEGTDLDVDFLWWEFFRIWFAGGIVEEGLGEFLGGADGELAADDLIGGEFLGVGIFEGEDSFCMADGDLALGEVALNIGVEIEEAHRVGDGCARLADAGGNFLLFQGEFLGKADVASSFFNWVEVFALEVLDESHLEDITVGGSALDDRDCGEAEFFGCPPTAFTGNEFVFPINKTGDERLDDTVLADGIDKVIEWCVDEMRPRLERGRDDVVDGDFTDPWRVVVVTGRGISGEGLVFFDEGSESFAECLFCHGVKIVDESWGEGKLI